MFWFVLIGLSPLLTHVNITLIMPQRLYLAALCLLFIRPKIYLDSVKTQPLNKARL